MKKSFGTVCLVLLIILAVSLPVGLLGSSSSSGGTSNGSRNTQTALVTPVISLSGDTISWTAVENAITYSIQSEDNELATTSETSFDLSSILSAVSTYTITVVAKGTGYGDSNASNDVDYEITAGYTVTITGSEYANWIKYSLDSGETWSFLQEGQTITNVKKIRFGENSGTFYDIQESTISITGLTPTYSGCWGEGGSQLNTEDWTITENVTVTINAVSGD